MEYVTTVGGHGSGLDVRLRELLRQSGRAGSLNPVATALVLAAARGQGAPVGLIRRHECRHGEGVTDCASAVAVDV